VVSERLLLVLIALISLLLVLLIVPLRPLSRSHKIRRLWHTGPRLQYLIIIQPRPYSNQHLLNLIARARPRFSPCTKLTGGIFARLRVHWLFGLLNSFFLVWLLVLDVLKSVN
jgi:hypothetical protein